MDEKELQEIEKYCWDVNDHTGVKMIQEIKRLRKALEEISDKFYTQSWEDTRNIARKALNQ